MTKVQTVLILYTKSHNSQQTIGKAVMWILNWAIGKRELRHPDILPSMANDQRKRSGIQAAKMSFHCRKAALFKFYRNIGSNVSCLKQCFNISLHPLHFQTWGTNLLSCYFLFCFRVRWGRDYTRGHWEEAEIHPGEVFSIKEKEESLHLSENPCKPADSKQCFLPQIRLCLINIV